MSDKIPKNESPRVAYSSFPKRCRWCGKKHGRSGEWCSDKCKEQEKQPAALTNRE